MSQRSTGKQTVIRSPWEINAGDGDLDRRNDSKTFTGSSSMGWELPSRHINNKGGRHISMGQLKTTIYSVLLTYKIAAGCIQGSLLGSHKTPLIVGLQTNRTREGAGRNVSEVSQ